MSKKMLYVATPLLASALFLAACAGQTTIESGTSVPVPVESPGTPPVSGNPEEPVKDINSLAEVPASAAAQQASEFWGSNLFNVDPAGILVNGNDPVDSLETVGNMVLAQLSEASAKSVLQSPYLKSDQDLRVSTVSAFADKWMTGAAKERLIEAASGTSDSAYNEVFAIIPLTPSRASEFNVGGVTATVREVDQMWDAAVRDIEVTIVDSTSVIASYTRSVGVPVVGGNGENVFALTEWNIDVELVPGDKPGDWLIEDYSFEVVG